MNRTSFLFLALAILLLGCSSLQRGTDPITTAKSDATIEKWVLEHPDAKASQKYYDKESLQKRLENYPDCSYLEPEPAYIVTFKDERKAATAIISMKQEVLCTSIPAPAVLTPIPNRLSITPPAPSPTVTTTPQVIRKVDEAKLVKNIKDFTDKPGWSSLCHASCKHIKELVKSVMCSMGGPGYESAMQTALGYGTGDSNDQERASAFHSRCTALTPEVLFDCEAYENGLLACGDDLKGCENGGYYLAFDPKKMAAENIEVRTPLFVDSTFLKDQIEGKNCDPLDTEPVSMRVGEEKYVYGRTIKVTSLNPHAATFNYTQNDGSNRAFTLEPQAGNNRIHLDYFTLHLDGIDNLEYFGPNQEYNQTLPYLVAHVRLSPD